MNINKLKEIQKVRKITQKEISDYVGMSQTAFSQALIRGDFKISLLEKIAEFLKVPVSYFFEEGTDAKKITGDKNNVNIGSNNSITNTVQDLELCKKENEQLKNELLTAKDEIIKLLRKKE